MGGTENILQSLTFATSLPLTMQRYVFSAKLPNFQRFFKNVYRFVAEMLINLNLAKIIGKKLA